MIRWTAAFLLTGAALLSAAEPNRAPSKTVPVLLELFTSEGCSSCPPADRLLQSFDEKQPIAGANLIVLSEHVDYWNSLGWKDPYSASLFSARQEQYSDRFKLSGVYTPQLVIDGQAEVVGGNSKKAMAEIEKAVSRPKIDLTLSPPAVDGNIVHFHVTSGDLPHSGGDADLYIALAQTRTQSQVAHGENAGSLLTHAGVVRVLVPAGKVKAGTSISEDLSVTIPAGLTAGDFRLVAFLQNSHAHSVVGAAQESLGHNGLTSRLEE